MANSLTVENQVSIQKYLRERVLSMYTQAQVARGTRLTQPAISDTLNKKRPITMNFVIELSRLMGDSVEHIIGESPYAQPLRLGQLPGYAQAEQAVRLVLIVDETAEFWLAIRDTTFPRNFKLITTDLLYGVASAASRGWGSEQTEPPPGSISG